MEKEAIQNSLIENEKTDKEITLKELNKMTPPEE